MIILYRLNGARNAELKMILLFVSTLQLSTCEYCFQIRKDFRKFVVKAPFILDE